MWTRFINFWRAIAAFIRHFLGQQPHIPPDTEVKPAEKESQTEPKAPEKELALPIGPSRYEKIDWENNPPPYRKKPGVLSYRESQFYRMLVGLFGQEYRILSMVRMADVIYLPKNVEDRKFHSINISSKHFDFVLCSKKDFAPVLVIELDDPTHLYYHRKQIDDFKDNACEVAGLPIMRIRVQHTYVEERLKEKIRQKLPD